MERILDRVIAAVAGISPDRVHVEDQAQNTEQNIRLSLKIIEKKN